VKIQSLQEKFDYQLSLIHSVINATPDLIFYKDYSSVDGEYVGCNEAFCNFIGKSEDEIIGKNDIELFDQEVGEFFRQKDSEVLNAKTTIVNEEWVDYPDGRRVCLSTSKTPFYNKDNSLVGIVAFSRDITDKKDLERYLEYKAHHDPLTNIPNRIYLEQQLSLHQQNNNKFAIMFIDLDHFKYINDTYGHDAGDYILIETTKRMKSIIRKTDIISRLGGDEFVILIDTVSRNILDGIATNIIKLLNKDFIFQKNILKIGCCIGISLYPTDTDDKEKILTTADQAMYEVKKSGKNNFKYYDE